MTETTSAAAAADADAAPTTPPVAAPTAWVPPDDLRSLATARGWDKLPPADAAEVIARSFANAEKKLGASPERLLRVPDDPAAEGALDPFYKAIGRPTRPEDYKIEKPSNLPENYPYQESLINDRREKFHAMGLSGRQVQALSDELHAANVAAMQVHDAEMATRRADGEALMRREWGANYDTNDAMARRVVAKYGGQEFLDWATQYGFAADPAFRRMLAAIGNDMAEHGATRSAAATSSAAEDVNKMIADKDFQERLSGRRGPEARKQAQTVWAAAVNRSAEESWRP